MTLKSKTPIEFFLRYFNDPFELLQHLRIQFSLTQSHFQDIFNL